MKKFVVITSTALAVILLALSVNAKEFVIDAQSKGASVGRIFEIELTSSMTGDISGGLMTVIYDSSIVEFRSVSSEYFTVEAKETNGKTRIVFVVSDDVESDVFLTLRFKGIAEGSFDMQFICDGFVDRKLNKVDAFCSSCNVEVSSKSSISGNKDNPSEEVAEKEDVLLNTDSYNVEVDKSDKNKNTVYIVGLVWFAVLMGYSLKLLIKTEEKIKVNKKR